MSLEMGVLVAVDCRAPGPIRVRFPGPGPYYRRRVKRTAKDPRNYRDPEDWFLVFSVGESGGETLVLVHPFYYERLLKGLS